MGILDLIFRKPTKTGNDYVNKDRRSIPAAEIDRMQRIEASAAYRKKIFRKYYSDYPEMPFISQDRELNTNWLEQVDIFENLVEKRMMKRYRDGLLPGHVYMLYWLGKSDRKRIPSYFEYKYGINFDKEKQFLVQGGYLDSEGKPTEAGKQAMERHKNIIEDHHPAPLNSGTPATLAPQQRPTKRIIPLRTTDVKEKVPDYDIPLLESEISYINDVIKYACGLAKIPTLFSIDPSRLAYGISLYQTHYTWTPYTQSGKSAKYPLMLRYAYDDTHSPNECFGELYYLQDGIIGKARLIFWVENIGYFFHLGQTNKQLVVKKVEKSVPPNRIALYKEKP